MANFFQFNGKNQQISEQQALQNKYNICRANLLLVVIFSLVNMVMPLLGSFTYFLFSAFIPYYLSFFGAFSSGLYPDEAYIELYGPNAMQELSFRGPVFLTVLLVLAVLIVGVYLLCWFMSKKHGMGWIIAALALFVVDTVLMFLINGFMIDSIIDILFHGWVIYYLIAGIVACVKLKNFSERDAVAAEWEAQSAEEAEPITPESSQKSAENGEEILSASLFDEDQGETKP